MATARDLYNNVKRQSIVAMIRLAVVGSEKDIVQLNRDQMRSGKTGKGDRIHPSYSSDAYPESKSTYHAHAPDPDLYLTGDFQNAMFMHVAAKTYTIDSKDGKTDDLTKKYKDIFGLDNNSIIKAQTTVMINLIQAYRRNTGL